MAIAEEWREIHEGYYEVSNLGNVRRAKPGISTFVGRPVMPISTGAGYYQVQLSGSASRRAYVHHLVVEAFLGCRRPGMVVNHIDTNKQNNALENLEYVSYAENSAHAVKHVSRRKGPTKPQVKGPGMPSGQHHWSRRTPDRVARGKSMPHCKLSAEIVVAMRNRVAAGEKQRDLAAEFGISPSQMSRIIRGTRWTYL